MPPERSFADLMGRLRAGDEDAAAQIFHRVAPQLIALARSRLSPRVRQKVDPEDVLQSVFRSFFTRHADGQLELEGWDSLWGLLTVITLRKCGKQYEHFCAGRRDIHREAAASPSPDGSATGWELAGRDPMPVAAVLLAELVEQLMRPLGRRDRDILSLRLQGYQVVEISSQVGCTERTVQRVLGRIRERLEGLHDEPAGPP